jgi:hypothetical protein
MAGNFGNFMSLGPDTRFNVLPNPIPQKNTQKDLLYRGHSPAPAELMQMPIDGTGQAAPLFNPFANVVINKQPQQPTGKQVRLPSGEMAVFPADMPDDAIANNITQFQAQQQRVQEFGNQHPLAQGLMQFVGPQFGFQPPSKDEFQIPIVPGNTFGMTPETLQSTRNVIANTQQLNASERIRQRVQMEREMEQEKDRAQALKLEQQRLKNQQMMEKMRLQQETDREKAKSTQGNIYMGKDGQPIWAGMDAQGKPVAKSVAIEGADTRTKYNPVGSPQSIIDATTNQPKLVQLLVDDYGNQKTITLGNAPGEEQEVQLINTLGPDGKPIQAFVPVRAGQAYPSQPDDPRKTGGLSESDAIKYAEKAASRELDAMAKDDPSLVYVGEDEIQRPSQKGLALYLPLIEKYKAYYLGQAPAPAPGGGGTVGPTILGIDPESGIGIID